MPQLVPVYFDPVTKQRYTKLTENYNEKEGGNLRLQQVVDKAMKLLAEKYELES